MVTRRQTSQKTKRPRGQGPPRRHHIQRNRDTKRLCEWVQQRNFQTLQALTGLWPVSIYHIPRNYATDLIDCDAAAVEIIPTIRPLVNQKPCLLTKKGKRTTPGLKYANEEFERRNEERRLFQQLSRYYLLRQDRYSWTRSPLLFHGEH